MEKLELNRIEVVLAEKKKSNNWLAEKLGVHPNTVSKWVNNTQQPPLKTFYDISVILKVDFRDMFVSTMPK
jgi:putative transcriptional regulator